MDPSRSSPEGHNQIRVSTPASFRRIGQRSSSRPVSPLPECPAPPQGNALRSLGAARVVACVLGRWIWASVTLFFTSPSFSTFTVHIIPIMTPSVCPSLCSPLSSVLYLRLLFVSVCLLLYPRGFSLAARLLRVSACPISPQLVTVCHLSFFLSSFT